MKLLKSILYFCFAILFFGCVDEDPPVEDIIFHIETSDVKAYSTMITITHNATNRDPYYCFIVEGTAIDLQHEIANFLASTPSSELAEFKHYQRKSYFQINHLRPQTTYTVIVFGMNDANRFYGSPSAVTFTTIGSNLVATENPNWVIEYKGYVVYNEKDYSLISVSLTGNAEERFFLAYFLAEELKQFTNTEELIVHATVDLLEKTEDTDTDYWLEDSAIRTGGTNFYRWLHEGDYVFYAIGINADGTPTGHYVKTDECHVDKYPADEKYTNLLNRWLVSYSDGKTNHVRFEERIVNKSLLLYGWGNIHDNPIYVTYNRSDGSLSIDVQVINSDTIIDFTDGSSVRGKLILTGGYYNQESKLKSTTTVTSLAIANLTENDEYVFETQFYVNYSDGTVSYDVGMMYKITPNQGASTLFSYHMFPFTMKKE